MTRQRTESSPPIIVIDKHTTLDLPQHKLSAAFNWNPLRHQPHTAADVSIVACCPVIDDVGRHSGRWQRSASAPDAGHSIGNDDDDNVGGGGGGGAVDALVTGDFLGSHLGVWPIQRRLRQNTVVL